MPIIGVLSGKGGVGKTTVTSNLASTLAQDYNRVVMVLDTNTYSSHIRLHFGVLEDVPYTLYDLVKKNDYSEYIHSHGPAGVELIPTSATVKNVSKSKLTKMIEKIGKSKYDFVIIDCAPGFGKDVQNAIKVCDELIVVTTPNIPDVEDAMKIIELVGMMKKNVKGFVLNRYADERYELTPEQVQETLDVPMLGIVPEDKKVPESIAAGVPLITYAKYSKASKAIKKIAANVSGDEYKPDGLITRLKHFLVGERYDFEKKPEEFVEQINGD